MGCPRTPGSVLRLCSGPITRERQARKSGARLPLGPTTKIVYVLNWATAAVLVILILSQLQHGNYVIPALDLAVVALNLFLAWNLYRRL